MRAYVDDNFAISEGIRECYDAPAIATVIATPAERENETSLLMQELRDTQETEASKRRVKELKKLILKFQKKVDKKQLFAPRKMA